MSRNWKKFIVRGQMANDSLGAVSYTAHTSADWLSLTISYLALIKMLIMIMISLTYR